MKTAALSSAIYNQAAKTFADNAAVIGSKYKAFETFAEALGNPRVISLDATTKYAREMVEANRQMFPDIPGRSSADILTHLEVNLPRIIY